MIKENLKRNFQVLDLWERGFTVDQISLQTGIPRSTTGYYVRKFNRKAKAGEPIALKRASKPNETSSALKGLEKFASLDNLFSRLNTKEGIDEVHKILEIHKLSSELYPVLFPTEEESEALFKQSPVLLEGFKIILGFKSLDSKTRAFFQDMFQQLKKNVEKTALKEKSHQKTEKKERTGMRVTIDETALRPKKKADRRLIRDE